MYQYITYETANIINSYIKRKDMSLHFHGLIGVNPVTIHFTNKIAIKYACHSLGITTKEIEAEDLREANSEADFIRRVVKHILEDNAKDHIKVRQIQEEARKKAEDEAIKEDKDRMYFTLNNKVLYIDKKDYELNLKFNEWLRSGKRFNGVSFEDFKDGK